MFGRCRPGACERINDLIADGATRGRIVDERRSNRFFVRAACTSIDDVCRDDTTDARENNERILFAITVISRARGPSAACAVRTNDPFLYTRTPRERRNACTATLNTVVK